MPKSIVQFSIYSAVILAGLLGLMAVSNPGVGPVWICLGAVLLLYLLIALVKFPAAFLAPVLFISRGMELPATPLSRAVNMQALTLGAILLFVAVCFRLISLSSGRQGGSLRELFKNQRKGIAAFLAFAALVAISFSYTPSPHYGSAKLLSFLAVGGLVFFGPFILLRDENDIRHFALAAVGLALMTGVSRIGADSRGVFGRHEVVTHIGIGSLAGMAILLLLHCKLFENRYARMLAILCIVWLAAGMIASVVRGPLISLVIVLVASLFTRPREMNLMSPRTAMLGVAVVLTALFIVPAHWIHGEAAAMVRNKTQELTQFVKGDSFSFEGSGGRRLYFFKAAEKAIVEKPIFGWGVGGWSYYYWRNDAWEYPHNVILEVGVEQGLMGIAAVLTLLALAFKAAKKAFDEPTGLFAFVLPLLAYNLFLTMTSGDIDDCRFLWFSCSVAFVAYGLIQLKQHREALVEPVVES